MADDTVLTAQTNTDADDSKPNDATQSDQDKGAQAGSDNPGNTDQTDGTDQSGEEGGQETDDDQDEGAPEQYEDFTLPEGMEIAEADLGEFTTLAKDLNLSQAQAQKLIDLEATRMERFAEQQAERWQDQIKQWGADVKADKEIGGNKMDENVAAARKALETFGTPELREALDQTGMGSHPEVVRFMFRVGKQLAEDTAIGGAQGGERSRAERLYPSMKQ